MKILNRTELESMKMTDITEHYNGIAVKLGIKTVKKFRDKDTSITRTLQNQELWQEENPAPVKKPAPKKTNSENTLYGLSKTAVLTTVEEKGGEGTIENTIHEGIFSGKDTVEQLAKYIIANHKRPRSGRQADMQYAIHNIKWFIKKGHLTVSE